jgi:hypothetical protein
MATDMDTAIWAMAGAGITTVGAEAAITAGKLNQSDQNT